MRIFTSRGASRPHDAGLVLTPVRRGPRLIARCGVAACGVAAGVLLAGCGPRAKAEAEAGSVPGLVTRAGARYEYYDVEGSTPLELSQSMRRARPASQPGIGRTAWNITWRTRWSGSPCRVQSADVRATIVVSMPRWKAPPDAPPALVEEWNRMLRALSVHEAGHVEHAVVAEREIRRALLAVTAPSCSTMELRTREIGQRLLEEHRMRDRRYDERTRSGYTQGVVWPPRAPADTTDAAPEEEPAQP
jgi:predicted secreted Zn-dependent protease